MRAPRGIGEEMKIQDQQLEITMASIEPCDDRFIDMVSMTPVERDECSYTMPIEFITHVRMPIGYGITTWDVYEMVVMSDVYIVS